jgi:hypothetical protein
MQLIQQSTYSKNIIAALESSKQPRLSSELFSLTYGSLISQILKDFPEVSKANAQLEKMGVNMGGRMCEEVLAKLPGQVGRCGERDFIGIVGEIVKVKLGFRYLWA